MLIAVSTPLDLVLAVSLKNADTSQPQRTAATVKLGLDGILETLKSREFDVTVMMSDGEAAIGKLRPYPLVLGIEIDISGAGGHVARVERMIQMIKERIRCHMTGRLPFTLTGFGITMLILICVSRINSQTDFSIGAGLDTGSNHFSSHLHTIRMAFQRTTK